MTQEIIPSVPVDPGDEFLRKKFYESVAEQDKLISKVTGQVLTVELAIHRRGIELDNGWKIILDRGLDIYQKSESKYELSEVDQSKRKCRETEIIYISE